MVAQPPARGLLPATGDSPSPGPPAHLLGVRTTLLCKTCSTRIGDYDLQRPEELEAVLLLCHAGGTHSGCHQLDVVMEVGARPLEAPHDAVEVSPAAGEVLVEVECQHPGCQHLHKRDRYLVPPWAVGAVILLTHAKQEGHVLRAWIDGRELTPL